MGRLDADQWTPDSQGGFVPPRRAEPHTHTMPDVSGPIIPSQIPDSGVSATKIAHEGWTVFTPTPTPTSGAFTAAIGSGRYIQIGRIVHYHYVATITTVGTGTGDVKFTLPVAPEGNVRAFGVGREDGVTGGIIVVYSGGGSIGQIRAPAALANGQIYDVAGTYEAAS